MRTPTFLAVLCLAVCVPAVAQDADSDVAELAGVRSMVVGINLQEIGGQHLAVESVQTHVELRLRQAGLDVVEAGEAPDGILGISIIVVADRTESGKPLGFSAVFQTQVSQYATIRLNDARSYYVTWEDMDLFVGTWGSLSGTIREVTDEHLDSFLNDFLEANS